jgi:hypothetical protein
VECNKLARLVVHRGLSNVIIESLFSLFSEADDFFWQREFLRDEILLFNTSSPVLSDVIKAGVICCPETLS